MHNRPFQKILGLSRFSKRAIALSVDSLIVILTVAAAFYLRLDTLDRPVGYQWFAYTAALLFSIPVFVTFGLYRAIFRYAGWGALMAVVRACAIYSGIYATVFAAIGITNVPRTVGIIQPVLLFISIGATRAIARFLLGSGLASMWGKLQRRRILIYGAGSAGRQLADALASSPEMRVVGFVDDDPALHGSSINDLRIYAPDSLLALLDRLEIDDLLLAMPSASRKRRNEIVEWIRGSPVGIRILPGVLDLAQGKVTASDLRELDIEDLLGRDPVEPVAALMQKNIRNKTVLVTGAGGSIGSELCRQILMAGPTVLVLIEITEFALYAIHQELEERQRNEHEPRTKLVPLLASVRDETRMAAIIGQWKPNTVYHAAAYKHVPLVESNPAEGIRNNVFGTMVAAQAAIDGGVDDFVLVSTDKAVRPTNIMGASKRLAEMLLQALASGGATTRFSIVRFGNVLGSSGSVVPLFRTQIGRGGPVTITDPEITRYFMTIPEASQLVIQAGAMGTGGEVFVLDMGEPVKILDLAAKMIKLSGLQLRSDENPEGDIEINYIGLRPGEKLYEELLIGANPRTTRHPRVMKANESFVPLPELITALALLETALEQDEPAIYFAMKDLVPEYQLPNHIVGHDSLAS